MVRVDELDYLNGYNVTGSLELGKNLGEVQFLKCNSETEFCCIGFQNRFFGMSRDLQILKNLTKTYDEAIFTKDSKLILGQDKIVVQFWEEEMKEIIG